MLIPSYKVLFFKVKNSQESISNKRQEATYKLITKKVQQLITQDILSINAKAILNKWDNILEDLYNNLDFKGIGYLTFIQIL